MRITTKGQVTIPQAIREKLGLLPHSEVEFDMNVSPSFGISELMVRFAEALFVETDGVVPNGDDHFERLWPEAQRIAETRTW